MDERTITLNYRNKMSLCDQILTELRSQILSGQLQPGERLPTVRQLAIQLRVNFNTVARAYRILDSEGMITTRQGQGTFVIDRTDTEQFDQQQFHMRFVSQLIEQIKAHSKRMGLQANKVFNEVAQSMIEEGLIPAPSVKKRRPHSQGSLYQRRYYTIRRDQSKDPVENQLPKSTKRKVVKTQKKARQHA